jgi:hypothetical protein
MANSQIRSLVETFVNQLEGVIRQEALRSLQTAIGGALGGAAPRQASAARASKSAKGGAKAKASKKGGKRARTSPAELAQNLGRLVAFVKSNPGSTSEKTRAALSFEKSVWLKTLRHGIESKQLTTKGQKRSTTLYPAKA